MKISLNWMRDHLEMSCTADELAARLTSAGMNVELRERHGDDAMWDVDVTTNRPDAMNHRGLAREAAAAECGTLKPLAAALSENATRAQDLSRVTVEDSAGCPRYCARVVCGVKVGPSPAWLAERLERCGVRPINNIVDATNFILLDVGQPLHAFDVASLAGHEIRVRRARQGEKIITLDGVERSLTGDDLVIADASRPVAVAGVMGAANSEIGPATTNVLIESAYFDPLSVRLTARRLGLKTEASQRFERGADRAMARTAVDLAAVLIVTLAGGEILGGVLDSNPVLPAPHEILVSLDKLSAFAGCAIPREFAVAALTALELQPRVEGQTITCLVPTHRADLELAEDVYEEILRLYGYDRIPSAPITMAALPGTRLGSWPLTERAREAAVAVGAAEAFTYSFTTAELEGVTAATPLAARGAAVALENPLSARLAVLRRSLLAGLIEAAGGNQRRGAERGLLAEVGRVFFADNDRVREEERLAFALAGQVGPWDAPRLVDFGDLKGVVETALAHLGIAEVTWRHAANHLLAPGEGAEVLVDGRVVAVAGRVAETVGAAFDLPAQVWVAEIDLGCAAAESIPSFKPLPRFPAVTADVTVRHKFALPFAEIVAAVSRLAPASLESVAPVVQYRGEGVAPDEVKTTLRLTYRSGDRSLTQDEVNTAHFALLDSLARTLAVSFI